MLSIILATLMPYQTIKLDKASFDLLTQPAPLKALILQDKAPAPVKEKDTNQSYTPKRARKSADC